MPLNVLRVASLEDLLWPLEKILLNFPKSRLIFHQASFFAFFIF